MRRDWESYMRPSAALTVFAQHWKSLHRDTSPLALIACIQERPQPSDFSLAIRGGYRAPSSTAQTAALIVCLVPTDKWNGIALSKVHCLVWSTQAICFLMPWEAPGRSDTPMWLPSLPRENVCGCRRKCSCILEQTIIVCTTWCRLVIGFRAIRQI